MIQLLIAGWPGYGLLVIIRFLGFAAVILVAAGAVAVIVLRPGVGDLWVKSLKLKPGRIVTGKIMFPGLLDTITVKTEVTGLADCPLAPRRLTCKVILSFTKPLDGPVIINLVAGLLVIVKFLVAGSKPVAVARIVLAPEVENLTVKSLKLESAGIVIVAAGPKVPPEGSLDSVTVRAEVVLAYWPLALKRATRKDMLSFTKPPLGAPMTESLTGDGGTGEPPGTTTTFALEFTPPDAGLKTVTSCSPGVATDAGIIAVSWVEELVTGVIGV